MRLAFFLVPVQDANEAAADLNRFLAANRILSVERHFLADGEKSAWALCVTFAEGNGAATPHLGGGRRSRVDYKDTLTPPEFAVFARLRALRKDRANAEGVPAYALFTDEQLAAMVQRRVTSPASLREIAGIGEARVEKYGPAFLEVLQEAALPTILAETPDDDAT